MMNNDDYIKKLNEDIYKEEVFYQWQHTGVARKEEKVLRWLVAILGPSIMMVFLSFGYDPEMNIFYYLSFFIVPVMMIFVVRYLFLPDKHYCYHLTPLGIHYTTRDMIPEVAYTIARGFAWLGVVVCIVAVVVLGPLSLVGAGAFALLSFSMINFRSEATKLEVFIAPTSVVYDIGNDNVLCIEFPKKCGLFAFIGDIYTSSAEEKAELLRQLNLHFPHLQVIKVNRYKDTDSYYEDFPVLGENECIQSYMEAHPSKAWNDE